MCVSVFRVTVAVLVMAVTVGRLLLFGLLTAVCCMLQRVCLCIVPLRAGMPVAAVTVVMTCTDSRERMRSQRLHADDVRVTHISQWQQLTCVTVCMEPKQPCQVEGQA